MAAKSALVAQRAQFDDIERMAKIGSYDVDPVKGLTASDTYLSIYKLPLSEFPLSTDGFAKRFIDDPAQYAESLVNIERLNQGEPIEGIRKIRTGDGSIAWVHFRCEPIGSENGVANRFRGIVRDVTSEKNKELTLLETAQLLSEVQRIARVGHFYWHLATDKLEVSKHYYEMFGIAEESRFSTVKEWVNHRCHPDDRFDAAATRKLIDKGAPYSVIRRTIDNNDEIRYYEIIAEPVNDDSDALVAYRGTIRDVSEYHRNLKKLEQSESRYRLISENMQDMVSLHDANGVTLFCTPSVTRMLGYAMNKVVGASPISWIHPDDRVTVQKVISAIRQDQSEGTRIEYRQMHRNGQYLWLETTIVPVHDDKGKLLHFQASTKNITDQHSATVALSASEERFRRLTELSSDWYWEQDAEHRLTFLSREKTVVAKLPREKLLGKTRWELYPDALSPREWAAHRVTLEARLPFRNLVTVVLHDKTKEILGYSSISGEPVYDASGDFIGYRGVGVDISQQKQAELALARQTDELSEANARLTEEAHLRHNLERNMLMAIEMELAQVGLELHDELGQDLTGIALMIKALQHKLVADAAPAATDAERISQLVNRTIRHTRMISHGLSPHIWGATGLASALMQLAEDINGIGVVHCEARLDTDVEINDEIAIRNLYRIAQESANNALKHSGATRLFISLKQFGARIQLVIADDGRNRASTLPTLGKMRSLHSIRHRARAINATLAIRQPSRLGTSIRVVWTQEKTKERRISHPLPPGQSKILKEHAV